MQIPNTVLQRAERRHGVIQRQDLVAGGLSRHQIERLVRTGQLSRLHRGVYRVSGMPETWEQLELAACLYTGGVASHRAALRLWDVTPLAELNWQVEVTVNLRNCPRPSGVIVHRSARIDHLGATKRHGIPVTTPQRMLIDLAVVADEGVFRRALERCVVSRLLSVATVRHELAGVGPGYPGAHKMRQELADWPVGGARPDSVLEVAFARLCSQGALPAPVFQYELAVGGRVRRVDFAYPDLRLAIEIVGFGCRTDRAYFQEERSRHNDFVLDGWRILEFTWHDITNRPDHVIKVILSALADLQGASI